MSMMQEPEAVGRIVEVADLAADQYGGDAEALLEDALAKVQERESE